MSLMEVRKMLKHFQACVGRGVRGQMCKCRARLPQQACPALNSFVSLCANEGLTLPACSVSPRYRSPSTQHIVAFFPCISPCELLVPGQLRKENTGENWGRIDLVLRNQNFQWTSALRGIAPQLETIDKWRWTSHELALWNRCELANGDRSFRQFGNGIRKINSFFPFQR